MKITSNRCWVRRLRIRCNAGPSPRDLSASSGLSYTSRVMDVDHVAGSMQDVMDVGHIAGSMYELKVHHNFLSAITGSSRSNILKPHVTFKSRHSHRISVAASPLNSRISRSACVTLMRITPAHIKNFMARRAFPIWVPDAANAKSKVLLVHYVSHLQTEAKANLRVEILSTKTKS